MTKNDLRKIGIYNPYELVAFGQPVIDYHRRASGRSVMPSHYSLSIKGKSFKNQPWHHRGALWFTFTGQERKPKELQKAFAKVKELFPEVEMVKAPWRETWVPKTDLDAAKAKLKEYETKDLIGYARQLGLDVTKPEEEKPR